MTHDEFEDAWEHWSPGFARALSYGGDMWTLEEVKAEILDGSAQFWSNPGGAMVTNFFYSRRIKALWIWLFAGARASVDALIPQAEAWGVTNGCTMFMGSGRKGLERLARPHGYRALSTLYVKDVSHGTMQ